MTLTRQPLRVQLVDVPAVAGASLEPHLREHGFEPQPTPSSRIDRATPGLVVLFVASAEAVGVLGELARSGHAVFVVSTSTDPNLAFEAGRLGARGLSRLPPTPATLEQLTRALQGAAQSVARPERALLLESASPSMRHAVEILMRCASSDEPVLIRGESGTGKSFLAAELHRRSPRRDNPFMEVSCPALPEHLLGAELFGHARGAFTGAIRDRIGRVEAADGGTLFLDEIGDLSPELQVQLLRFLQDHSFERVGENRPRRANVRVVAATNRDLEADVAQGRFRLDLFYRLGVVDVRIPALRERPEDILPLARHLLATRAQVTGLSVRLLAPSAEHALLSHDFPGNVRELENELARAQVLCSGEVIEASDLSDRIRRPGAAVPFVGGQFTLDEIEREHIERVVARSRSFEAAANELGIDDSTLWRKRKRMKLSGPAPIHAKPPNRPVSPPGPAAPAPSYRR